MTGKLKKAELIVFDCDGVLIDSEFAGQKVEKAILGDLGYPISDEEFEEQFMGHPTEWIIRTAAARSGHPVSEAMLADWTGRVREAAHAALAIDGMDQMLSRLSQRRAVVSNSTKADLRDKLTRTGLHAYFGGPVLSRDDVSKPKPAPDLYIEAVRRSGVAPGEAVAIEDSTVGVAAARAAGVEVYGFVGGRHCSRSSAGRLTDQGCVRVFSNATEILAAFS
ncbi:MAG: HAD family phosphatase [Hyphomicrobiaceae bacterium]|nr:HAD family phosphatase [Hyphomicrobiaceae bacterium]